MGCKPQGPHAPRPAWPEASVAKGRFATAPECPKACMPQGPNASRTAWHMACMPQVRLPQIIKARAHLFFFRAPNSVCAKAHTHQGPHAPELDCPVPRAPLISRPKGRAPHGPLTPGTYFSRALHGPRAALAARLNSARFFPLVRYLLTHHSPWPQFCLPTSMRSQKSVCHQRHAPRILFAKTTSHQELQWPTTPHAKSTPSHDCVMLGTLYAMISTRQELTMPRVRGKNSARAPPPRSCAWRPISQGETSTLTRSETSGSLKAALRHAESNA